MKSQHLILAAILTTLVYGCGQKGPLFLPGERDARSEVPELSRESIEEALGDDFENDGDQGDVPPRTRREEEEAEPYIDPASPPDESVDH